MFFPGFLPLHKVNFVPMLDEQKINNFELLKEALIVVDFKPMCDAEKLRKGNFMEHKKFLYGFKKFHNSSNDGGIKEKAEDLIYDIPIKNVRALYQKTHFSPRWHWDIIRLIDSSTIPNLPSWDHSYGLEIHSAIVSFSGAKGSLYEGGNWNTLVIFSPDYPALAPKVKFVDPIFNQHVNNRATNSYGEIDQEFLQKLWDAQSVEEKDLLALFTTIIPKILRGKECYDIPNEGFSSLEYERVVRELIMHTTSDLRFNASYSLPLPSTNSSRVIKDLYILADKGHIVHPYSVLTRFRGIGPYDGTIIPLMLECSVGYPEAVPKMTFLTEVFHPSNNEDSLS